MEQKKLDRINYLSRESKVRELTAEEKEEQTALRYEYRKTVLGSLTAHLENTYIVEKDGVAHKVRRKNGGN